MVSERLGERWQRFVQAAASIRDDFATTVGDAPAGPLTERLQAMSATLGAQYAELEAVARDADRLEQAVRRLGPDAVTDAYKQAKRSAAAEDSARLVSLAAQHASVQRLLNTVDETEQRLDLAIVRLRELLVRGTEIALGRNQDAADALDRDLAAVGVELTALHAALAEADAAG